MFWDGLESTSPQQICEAVAVSGQRATLLGLPHAKVILQFESKAAVFREDNSERTP
jgi:hypothetical protein